MPSSTKKQNNQEYLSFKGIFNIMFELLITGYVSITLHDFCFSEYTAPVNLSLISKTDVPGNNEAVLPSLPIPRSKISNDRFYQ